ncbi:MAG: 2-phospho-L-lactate guanylyltransferase [Chloroflexota bacterium]|nr:2-phospho-L-lactate guanylyltransferase [Chloroflexota bacterium]
MKTVAVVPIKSLLQAKSRLAGMLTPTERAGLAREMLALVLDAIQQSGVIAGVAVISPRPEELHLPPGVTPLLQMEEGLNALLEQGRDWATAQGADALMLAFADLPLLLPTNIQSIVPIAKSPNTVVLAPDRHEQGTNLMLLHPPALIPFSFGPNSYDAHRAAALAAGARLEVYRSCGTALDIDTPDDLACLEQLRLAAAG